MKKVIKFFCILFLIIALLSISIFGFLYVKSWYQKNRSYDMIFASEADKNIAGVIENSIYLISGSKPLDTFTEEYKKPSVKDLKKYDLDITLTNITHVCYSKSIYSASAQDMLNGIGIKNKYADLIENKKQIEYGEGSSLFMFVKSNGDIIPVFISAYLYDLQTNIEFPELDYAAGCAKLKNKNLNIKINASLKNKALIILE